MFKLFLAFALIGLIHALAEEPDMSPKEVENAMRAFLSSDKYTVPMKGDKVDWDRVGAQADEHVNKLEMYNAELEKGKTREQAAAIADIHLGFAGSKSDGFPYVCYWRAEKFRKECGPKNGVGKYLSYSAAKFTLRKYGFLKKGEKTVSYQPACRKHDLCYSRCERSRKICDDQFNSNLHRICKKKLTGRMAHCRKACRSVIGLFVKLVRRHASFAYCDEVIATNKKYMLFKTKTKFKKVNAHCVDRIGTPIGKISSKSDKVLATAIIRSKRISSVWVDNRSCRKVRCYGRGACTYLRSNGRIYRTNRCGNRNFLCERTLKNGKIPHYRPEEVVEVKPLNANEETPMLTENEWVLGNSVSLGLFGFVVISFVVFVMLKINARWWDQKQVAAQSEDQPLLA